MQFQTKHVVVDAMQFLDTAENPNGRADAVAWARGEGANLTEGNWPILTSGGNMTGVSSGDWLVKRPNGTFTSVKPDVFEMFYEAVPEA